MSSTNAQHDAAFRPLAGMTLSGRYLLESPIEQGAAGEVWRGQHASIGKRVAIKILKAEHARDRDDWAIKRMLREARLLSEIDHPAVVDVLDFGEDGGCPYIVMALLEGRTLAKALAEGGPMSWARAAPLLQQMMEGLDAAHRVGVIHRDLKPANIILLDADTRVKLIDFGIAGAHGRTRITVDGEVLGTPHFMSPEQARTMDLAATSDIYSFGCLAFAMLAGRPPYVGTLGEIVTQHLTAPVPAVSELVGADVPRDVCVAIQRCMSKEPSRRFQTIGALHEVLLGRPLGSEGMVTARTRARAARRKRGVAMGVAAGGAFAVGLAAIAIVTWDRAEPSALPRVSAPAHRTVAKPSPEPAANDAVPPVRLDPAELPVEIATPKVLPEAEDREDRPRKTKRGAIVAPLPDPTDLEPAPVVEPPPEKPMPSVEKVGGLKNPFDAE